MKTSVFKLTEKAIKASKDNGTHKRMLENKDRLLKVCGASKIEQLSKEGEVLYYLGITSILKNINGSEKKCSTCGQIKHVDFFYFDYKSKDSCGSHCKECHRKYKSDSNSNKKNTKKKSSSPECSGIRIVVTYPISQRITEDNWVKIYKSKVFGEDDTFASVIDWAKKENISISTLIITDIEL